MTVRDSQATRRRILDAGRDEFSQHGYAGARVDRIAHAAGCNKQLISAYFGGKEGLYAAVREEMITGTMDEVPFDAFDLPGYAGRLFDFHQAQPQVLRLTTWAQLEGPASMSPAAAESTYAKIDAIRAAQQSGAVRADHPPEALLVLVLKLATIGSPGSGETAFPGATPDAFRNLIVGTVRTLTAPVRGPG
ncbi:TetR family transcriptional regulator [Micromonospora sp. WMMD1082]|uniref:TetR family transcriptional regulator n=1 Tax=Micromonospora sp. WMMD1082 TaxID=3016104 RepID=UPI002416A863|nr:TetR family transcriptional regulator [Micromonospora sp. WMMD1082]MDG4793004.1 TetR family transcriptional regulator [Micromonospora sp. WMMD1082]